MDYLYIRIERLRKELEREESEYLKERGWRRSRANPMRVWLWRKEFNGYGIVLERHEALKAQLAIDKKEHERVGRSA